MENIATANKREYLKRYREANRQRLKELNREWREKNREQHCAASREWYASNRSRALATKRVYQSNNKSLINAYQKRRMTQDPVFRLCKNLRSRLWPYLKGKRKKGSTRALLGCSFEDLKLWLESQFQPGMTWENQGKVWHVDHIIPCATVDLSLAHNQRVVCHYTNFRPLIAADNIRRQDTITEADKDLWWANVQESWWKEYLHYGKTIVQE